MTTSSAHLRHSTRDYLAQHNTDDPLEAQHLLRMRALAGVAGDPFSRKHFEPGHFTASAFVISRDRRKVLLIRHRKLKRWLQPGGHIDIEDADPLQAAMREVQEETAVRALQVLGEGLLDVDVHGIPPLGQEPAHEHFDLRFCFTTDEQGDDASDEIEGLRWFPLTEVAAIETDESVRRAAARVVQRFAVT